MAQSQTSGYDILVQLSEQQLNDIAAALPLPPLPSNPVVKQLTFNHLEMDAAFTNSTPNGVRLYFDFVAKVGIPTYSGTMDFIAVIDVRPDVNGKRVLGIYWQPGVSQVTVLNTPVNNLLTPIFQGALSNPNMPKPLVTLGTVDPAAGTDPLTPTDMHVKVIDDPDPSGIDCVTMMLNTGGSTGGDPAGVTHYLGNGPNGAVVTLSNQLVLERLLAPALGSALGATFNPPCVLASPVEIFSLTSTQYGPFGHVLYSVSMHINLQSMSVVVDGNYFRVTGTVGGSGNGWSVTGNFDVRLYVQVNNGALELVQVVVVPLQAEFDFAWWVWVLLGLGAGPLGLLLTAFVENAINVVIDRLLARFADIGSQLSGIALPSIPLGIPGGQLTIQNVQLDDLVLQGPVQLIPGAAAGLAICGDLNLSHTDTTTLKNGVLVTGWAVFSIHGGDHYVITRKFSHRGLFSAAVSQPVLPATFSWTSRWNADRRDRQSGLAATRPVWTNRKQDDRFPDRRRTLLDLDRTRHHRSRNDIIAEDGRWRRAHFDRVHGADARRLQGRRLHFAAGGRLHAGSDNNAPRHRRPDRGRRCQGCFDRDSRIDHACGRQEAGAHRRVPQRSWHETAGRIARPPTRGIASAPHRIKDAGHTRTSRKASFRLVQKSSSL